MFSEYPVSDIIPSLKDALSNKQVVILEAPPGAGKSTILPLALYKEDWLKGKKVIMLEPRRLAARSVAARMSSLLDEEPGETVGYRVRFENRVGKGTIIEVVTEGILTRMLQNDNALDNVGLVIFDEFHERSLNADLGLALCYQAQQMLREDLRILIMSATLDGKAISAMFDNAPVISSAGRAFPVEIIYTARDEKEYLQVSMARLIRRALKEQQGDILCFLPGAGEILRTQELLEQEGTAAIVYPLYGDLSQQKQQEAIMPHPQGRRKIVLATSIAETSLTIEGVTTVIDSGLSRVPRFDPRSGLTRLETVKVTRDAADQRAGRAGRLGPGVCYRLWAQSEQQHLNPNRKPEILEADLAPLMLELSQWGVKDLNELVLLNVPGQGAVAQAKELLEQLEATREGKITTKGKQMLQMPTHPRIAHLLIDAQTWSAKGQYNYTALAADVAALLEERDPLAKESGTDLSLRVEILRKWRSKQQVNADRRVLERIERLAMSWRKHLNCEQDNSMPDGYATGKLIAAAYPERIAKKADSKGLRYRLANGRFAKISESDALHNEEYLAVAQLDGGSNEGRIYIAAPLDPADLKDLAQEKQTAKWDEARGMVVASIDRSVGSIVLESKPVNKIDEQLRTSILFSVIREKGLRVLGWSDSQDNLQSRMMSIRSWRPEEGWPDVSEQHLLETLEDWLLPYLQNITKLSELQKLNLNQILISLIPWELSQKLEKLAPAKLMVPTGSMIPLSYSKDGSRVEMAVRLQEVFGLFETPTVNDGRQKVVMQLLSPGYKPVQVTQDLHSFWQRTYFEVRKDLLSRYPKHHWPEDPLTAEAMRGPKKRK